MDFGALIKKPNNFPSSFKIEEDSLAEIDENALVLREINRKRERSKLLDVNSKLLLAKTGKKKDTKEVEFTDQYFEKIKFKQKSKAGKKWNEKTIKKLIFMVLIMNVGMTIFDSSLYLSSEDVWDVDIMVLGDLIDKNALNQNNISPFMSDLMARYKDKDTPFASISISTMYSYSKENLDMKAYRISEMGEAKYRESVEIQFLIDITSRKFYDNLFQLLSMVFIVATLIAAYIFSSKDSQIFISEPVSQMANIFNSVLMDPLDVVFNPFYLGAKPDRNMFEKLEQEYSMIGNMTSHLALWLSYCYGKKMVPLITNRFIMCQPTPLTAMVGDKYCAYFSIIEVQNLLDNLEPNEEDTFDFVQMMADVVYRTTDLYNGGTIYLNEGKFFLIWKLRNVNREANFKQVSRDSSETASVIITTNLKILFGLAYRHRLYDVDFKHNGLARATIHCGVLYESIVGSPFHKIDVHYFGLDLNALHVFHDMSNKYKTSMLLTEHVFAIIPECMKVKCRKIDVIKFPFYPQPLDIHTIDLRLDEVEATTEDKLREENLPTYKKRLAHAHIKDYIDDKLIKGAKNSLFLEDPDLEGLLSRNFEFRKNFRNSIDFYILGAWDSAKPFLEKAMSLEPEDGPSKFLWQFMQQHNFEKPASWRGFRVSSKILK